MADGTTVVASTGDSGPSNTEGSPGTRPRRDRRRGKYLYRVFAQTNGWLYDLAQHIHKGSGTPSYHLGQSTPGWLSNEVSTLSSWA